MPVQAKPFCIKGYLSPIKNLVTVYKELILCLNLRDPDWKEDLYHHGNYSMPDDPVGCADRVIRRGATSVSRWKGKPRRSAVIPSVEKPEIPVYRTVHRAGGGALRWRMHRVIVICLLILHRRRFRCAEPRRRLQRHHHQDCRCFGGNRYLLICLVALVFMFFGSTARHVQEVVALARRCNLLTMGGMRCWAWESLWRSVSLLSGHLQSYSVGLSRGEWRGCLSSRRAPFRLLIFALLYALLCLSSSATPGKLNKIGAALIYKGGSKYGKFHRSQVLSLNLRSRD